MKLEEMSWPDVEEVAPNTVALLPIASIEQHGLHLAVSTDTVLATHIASRAESALPEEVVLCPTLAFGSSHHHLAFPGTMSLSPETYITVLVELTESLLKSGFRRIVLLNGHGGNIVPANAALSILSHRYDDVLAPNIALAVYWEMAGTTFRGEAPMESPALTHADEYETSMMLHLYPERVRMERAEPPVSALSNDYIRWQLDRPSRGVGMSKMFHVFLSNGANGSPQLATAAKGEHLLDRASEAVIAFIQDFKTWPFLHDLRPEKTKNSP